MDIISLNFFFAVLLSIIIFYYSSAKYRVAILTFISCLFIASYGIYLLIYILLYGVFNYLIAIKIAASKHKILLFRIGIFINLLQLVILRYSTFAIAPLLELININLDISILYSYILPIGISYFTLQGIGYLINIRMGWEEPEKRIANFLLYLVFFPKFLAGPIERSKHFLSQLDLKQSFNQDRVISGLRLALFGYLKKVAIANQLAPFISLHYSQLDSSNSLNLWFIVFLQPLYLYFDFSGYSDIAIGIAKMFGIELVPNFNKPFFSESMTSFWKRFHISLSSWFNDYVFRQTSFKLRKFGVIASVYAVFVTWIFFGIWHGAGWNFMVLGLIQALAIIYEFFTKKWRTMLFSKFSPNMRIYIGRMATYTFYSFSLIFFFSPNLTSAFNFTSKLISFDSSLKSLFINIVENISPLVFVLIFLILMKELFESDYKNAATKIAYIWSGNKTINRVFRWTIYSLAITLIFIYGNDFQNFIYAQF
jgi:alginate O-acetyltransferase complex protein AlgI